MAANRPVQRMPDALNNCRCWSASDHAHSQLSACLPCSAPRLPAAPAGPSGSGKTSLLSILGSRAQKAMRVEGSATFNGHPLTKRLKRQVGYVLQVGRWGWSNGVRARTGLQMALRA